MGVESVKGLGVYCDGAVEVMPQRTAGRVRSDIEF